MSCVVALIRKEEWKWVGWLSILNSGTGVTTQRPGLAQMVHLMDSRKPLDLNPHPDHWAASLTMPCHRGLSHEAVVFLVEGFQRFLPIPSPEQSKARGFFFLCGSIQCGEKIKVHKKLHTEISAQSGSPTAYITYSILSSLVIIFDYCIELPGQKPVLKCNLQCFAEHAGDLT